MLSQRYIPSVSNHRERNGSLIKSQEEATFILYFERLRTTTTKNSTRQKYLPKAPETRRGIFGIPELEIYGREQKEIGMEMQKKIHTVKGFTSTELNC